MPWPTPQDYNEAIQSPHLAFQDPVLKAGLPELTPLGLPRPITGNFASVYRIRSAQGDLAVRCFWREFADMQERYAAISRHLNAARLPYTVGFEYLRRGILVRGQWYPILKMEWVEGELLNEYVERHLHDSAALLDLARRWVTMVETLDRVSVAHGDLQHGNVLVVGGDLKLVDYDGMFVPALDGKPSHEVGHPNYQHPSRGGLHFGPAVDRFSALVVYLSLVALSVDPGLWGHLNGGDECLLLRKADFDPGGNSSALAMLEKCANLGLCTLVQQFRSCLTYEPTQVPPLGDLLGGDPGRNDGQGRQILRLPLRSVGPWRRKNAAREAGPDGAPRPVMGPPVWVSEAVWSDRPASREFASSLTGPRRCVAVSTLLLCVCSLATVSGPISVALPAPALAVLSLLVDLLVLAACFHADPTVSVRRSLIREERKQIRSLRAIQREVRRREERKRRLLARRDSHMTGLGERRTRLLHDEHRRRERALVPIDEMLGMLEAEQAQLEERVREASQIALRRLQDKHVKRTLSSAALWPASIPELGPFAKTGLWLSGVRTAADVSAERIASLKRLERERVLSLLAWRASVQAHARRTKPRDLPPRLEARVGSRYRRRIERLTLHQKKLSSRKEFIAAVLDDLLAARQMSVDRKTSLALERYVNELRELEMEIVEARRDEPLHNRKLTNVQSELAAFRELTFRRYIVAVLGGMTVL